MLGLIVAGLTAGSAVTSDHTAAAPARNVWGVALPAKSAASPAQLKWLSSRGVTTVVAFGVPKSSLSRLARAASSAKLNVIAPSPVAPKRACRTQRGPLRTCAAVAQTAVGAARLARRSLVDYVVVRVKTPRQLRMLRGSKAKRSLIVAVLPMGASSSARATWRTAVEYAAADPVLALAVASKPASSPLLNGYLSELPKPRTAADAGLPAPTSLVVTAATTTTVTLRWNAAPGSVQGYGIYQDGTLVLNVEATSITLTGLQCGRTYTFAVDAYDAGGTRSSRASTSSATSACAGGGGGGGGGTSDTAAPTTPSGLVRTSGTQTSISVSWNAASDNVGVAGYGLYRAGALVGTSIPRSYSFSGLACGSTYSLSVDAFDAAGNRSGRTTISAATSACAGGGDTSAPSVPGSLARTGSTATSITVGWSAASDNVGVTGYGLYRNGASAGSTAATSFSFTGLACGTSYTLGVDAYDAAGNRSSRANLTAATSACPAPTDTQRPSVPQGLGFGTITATSVALVWNASTDNVGVAGYRLSRNGVSVATVTTPGYTYTGLTCGTGYSFMVEAYDAAGNFSIGAEAVANTSTLACSGGGSPPPPPPPSGSASVYLSPSGSDTAACTATAPCRSFARAYTVAASGAVVSVGAGTYGPQFFAGGFGATQAGGTKQLTFLGEPGNAVRQLHFGSPNLTFDGINVDAGGAKLGGSDGATFENGGRPFLFKNGSIGNVVDQKGAMINGSGMVFDNVRFHDVIIQTSGVHSECIFASVPEGMIVRNSTFENCAVMDIFFVYPDWWSPLPAPYGNVVLENNTFGKPDGTYTLYIAKIGTSIPTSAPVNGWRIRNNAFGSAVNIDAPIGTGNIFCGNTGSVSTSWTSAC